MVNYSTNVQPKLTLNDLMKLPGVTFASIETAGNGVVRIEINRELKPSEKTAIETAIDKPLTLLTSEI